MLHRLTLRVLPTLTQAVTSGEARTRKRVVMLVPGLLAYGIYRAVKSIVPLTDPWVLLLLSGLLCSLTAVAAYGVGRRQPLALLFATDSPRLLAWVGGWIGFVYGVQLSVMVLALLRVVVGYDFLAHADGPAMMAIIIACTSVARDAFEIGHVRWLQQSGAAVVTFPDGEALRTLLRARPRYLALALLGGTAATFLLTWLASVAGAGSELGQLIVVTTVVGSIAVWAYLDGERREAAGARALEPWGRRLGTVGWRGLFRFWWWPGLAFAATYHLSLYGAAVFLLRIDTATSFVQASVGSLVAGIMILYCSYLGQRRSVEDRLHRVVPSSLLRCPFVLGILSKKQVPEPGSMDMAVLEDVGRRG